MAKSKLIRILIKGGILTPGYFIKVMNAAKKSGNSTLKFGSRQDILFEVPKKLVQETELCMNESRIGFEWKGSKETRKQNIVTTFVTSGILESTSWLTEGTYSKILDLFDYDPQITINLVDSKQNLQPLFTGQLNFISSAIQDYWYIYINFSNKLSQVPFLVNSTEIPVLSKYCERILIDKKNPGGEEIISLIESDLKIKKHQIVNKLALPTGFFLYYEGIEKMLNGKNYWAGFYWRNNNYDIQFIEKICELCLKTDIAKISVTPWKTFLIKDIKPEYLPLWEQLIGKMGINMRHSSFELNWHLPVMDKQAYKLKKYLVNQFDKVDVRTFGLSFSISKKGQNEFHTALEIKRKEPLGFLGKYNPFISYNVELAKDYNPNTMIYYTYAQNISKHELPEVLIKLCKDYYLNLRTDKRESPAIIEKQDEIKLIEIYQCSNCFSIYSELAGDDSIGIKPGILFNDLPNTYKCAVCESPKEAFEQKKFPDKYLQIN